MSAHIKNLGVQDYVTTWQAMQDFTLSRDQNTRDEIWQVEHPPVFTLGLNGRKEHLLNTADIPVVETDRGGQVTYHGPGQLVLYILLDIKRLQKGPRQLVSILENAMIATLAQYGIQAAAKKEAPGVYVDEKKIGAVGLRIKKGCCYHGLSLNNAMDLSPFKAINPCGYPGLEVTQIHAYGVNIDTQELALPVITQLTEMLYT
ncbi:lipoyl(octanoyl) transferase LipB [methane-oxidizing endosymbiont of Gigantopelta aegis]|uniref:lipoyl(octanoyl) transferase LipB n=1 Tax=methane-oxidizing endosymbiont of Gigantopelta aegis TaxID=2794938 RepID=UPI0018DE1CB6|nr:lipoyl(octanoyl) transferase LipB [methane-oxidizing endosymbiont of Gigantopelta aegis]